MQDSIVPEVKSRLNIVDVVGSYVRLTKSGAHWKACCPFHNEKTPSFMVNEERQMFHCFGCGKGGDVFSFVEEIEGIGFREALELLAEKAGVEVPAFNKAASRSPGETDRPDRSREILELSTKFFEKQLWEGPGAKKALPYLRKRGLSEESIRSFRVGYAPDGWRYLHDFLLSRGYEPSELEAVGLVIAKEGRDGHYDRFRDRITFPITDVVGRVIGYSARVAPGGDENQAKYINTPETALYHKGRAIYGVSFAKQAIKDAGTTVLVEGQMDVIACHQAEIRNVVAASGTALTEDHLDILKRYGNGIQLFFDMDAAGQEAAWRSALLGLGKGMSVSVVSIPSGKDAADAALEDADALRKSIATAIPAPEHFLKRFLGKYDVSGPEGKKAVAEAFVPLLLAMESDIDRDFWKRELSSRIGVEDRAVLSVLRGEEDRRNRESAYGSRTAEPETPRPGGSFSRRSETVRDRMIGFLLLDPELISREPMPDTVREYLSSDPLFVAVSADAGGAVMDGLSDEMSKRRAASLLFEAERFVGTGEGYDFERKEERTRAFADLLTQLSAELRKEEISSLAAAIEAARKSGDRGLEKELLTRLSERTRH